MKKLILLSLILAYQAHASLLYKIEKGVDLYNQNNYRAAAIYFQNYINSNPNDEDGYFWLGKTFSAQDLQLKATSAYKHAYQIAVNNKNIDKIEFENNEYDNLEDYLDMAISYYEGKNYQEALNYTDMMLKIDPDSASAYFLKSKIALIENNKENASLYFKKAVLLNNSLLKTKLAKNLGFEKIPELTKEEYALYAQKSYFKGEINSAIDYLNKCLELDKNNIDTYLALINCYLKNKNYAQAKSTITKAQAIAKSSPSLMLLEAKYNSANGIESEDILLEAYKLNPNNKQVLLNLAELYADRKDYNNSKKYYENLINIDDSLYEAYFGYIYSLIKLDESDKAQPLIRKITAINNNQAEISYLLSLLCQSKGEYKDSLGYVLNSLKTDKNPKYLLQAGKLNFILKNYKASVDFLKNCTDEEAKEYLTADYIMLNNINEIQLILNSVPIDKNRILYKYYLYKISKLNSNKELNLILKQRPATIEDYLDLAKINYFENRIEDKNKILDNAYKKFNQKPEIKFLMQELQ